MPGMVVILPEATPGQPLANVVEWVQANPQEKAMSDRPFDDTNDSSDDRDKSFEEQIRDLLGQMGVSGTDGQFDFNAMMAQMAQALGQLGIGMPGAAASTSPINWDHAKHATRTWVAAKGPDPTPSVVDQRQVADAVRLAEMWLDQATTFAQVEAPPAAWSRAEWIEATMDSWRGVVEPIVTNLAEAMVTMLDSEGHANGIPGMSGAGGLGGMLSPLLRGAAGTMYAAQLVEALGGLATQVLTPTEIGLQLLAKPKVAILTTNVAEFGEGLNVSREDLLLYLAAREGARQRLFNSVPWLAPQLTALLEHYASEITIDASALQDAISLGDLDELTPEKLEEASAALQGRLFEPTKTDLQNDILTRLETLLALIEGWIDVVVTQATEKWMPNANAIAEALRRRRATGGPAEKAFQTLVGLQLRPRRLRDATNLWKIIDDAKGVDERDAIWRHPDLVPTSADLDDPLGFRDGRPDDQPDDLDAELARILEEGLGEENPEA